MLARVDIAVLPAYMYVYIHIYILLLYSYIVYVCVLEVSELMVPVQLWEAITAVAMIAAPAKAFCIWSFC